MPRMEECLTPFCRKMRGENLPEIAIKTFNHYYKQLAEGRTGLIPETDILPIDTLADVESMAPKGSAELGRQNIHKTVIIKLNGGLGTGMGMKKAKSLLKVKNGFTFLDIIVRQARSLSVPVPVIFMNSFSTQMDTLEALKAYPHMGGGHVPLDFLQHKIPKVVASDLSPVDCPDNPELEWCPPGHGDIYSSLLTSGVLDKLLQAGYEYAFVSNSDNLGAALDPCLLGYFVKSGISFMMEVADRTKADRKGGHLSQLKSGRFVLREIAQTPEADMTSFQDVQRHKYFNTNNIWVHLPSLNDIMDRKKGILGLPMIRNLKTLDPRDPESTPVFQLETAMGAAISVFDAAGAIRVPRTRFMPVKNTNDLLAIRSNRFILNDNFQLVANPKRKQNQILIDLDPTYYKFIDHFENRFPFDVPSLLDCESLKVNGDVRFGSGITLKGEVTFCNDNGDTYDMGNRRMIQGTLRV